MAAKVGSLMIDIGANVARLQKDMGKANNEISRFRKQSESQFRAVAKAATAAVAVFGGMAAVRGLNNMVRENLKYADSIAKVSDKLGVSTSFLQEMRHAADLTGVSQDTLDMSLQRFTRRLGEASQGGGELLGTLKKYDIALTDSEGRTRSSTAVLDDLADVIQKTENPMERLRIATKAFDSEGAAMVNTLKGGSLGLGEMRKQARDAGIVIEEDLLRASEKANDALGLMDKVIKTQVVRAVASMSDEIAALAVTVIDNKDQIASMAATFATIAGGALNAAVWVNKFASALVNLGNSTAAKLYGSDTVAGQTEARLAAARKELSEVNSALESGASTDTAGGSMGDFFKLLDERGKLEARVNNLQKTWMGLSDEDFKPQDAATKAAEQLQATYKALAGGGGGGGRGGGGKSAAREAEKAAKEAERAMQDRLKFQQDLTDKLNALTMDHFDYDKWALDQQVTEWRTKYGEMSEIAAYEAAKLKEINDEQVEYALRTSTEMSDGFKRAWQDYYDYASDAASNAEEALGNSLNAIEDFFVEFATTLEFNWKSLIDSMISELARLGTRALMGDFMGLFGGGGGGSIVTSILGAFAGGGGAPTAVGFLGGRAAGGHVRPGGLYRVGESGPEYLKMGGRGGEIIPNRDSGGISINVPISISGGEMSARLESRLRTDMEQTALRVLREEMR